MKKNYDFNVYVDACNCIQAIKEKNLLLLLSVLSLLPDCIVLSAGDLSFWSAVGRISSVPLGKPQGVQELLNAALISQGGRGDHSLISAHSCRVPFLIPWFLEGIL